MAKKCSAGLGWSQAYKFMTGDKPSKRIQNAAHEEAVSSLVLGYLHRSPIELLRGVALRITLEST